MLTTLVASSKGGCGKSTLVTQLASYWAQAGQHTAIVDTDRQGSSFRWASLRPDNVPGVLGVEGSRRALQKLPLALAATRLKPWTHASQDALGQLAEQSPFPVGAQLRHSQAYVLLAARG